MKALMIGFAVLVLSGCGGSDAIDQPTDGGSDVAKYDNGYECYSDNECKTGWKCLEHKCVEKPECEKDSDCTPKDEFKESLMVCKTGKCIAYEEQDPCFGKECSGSCAQCGTFTGCSKTTNTCVDACKEIKRQSREARDNLCEKFVGQYSCPVCACWNQNRSEYDASIPGCKQPVTLQCLKDGYDGGHDAKTLKDGSAVNTDWSDRTCSSCLYYLHLTKERSPVDECK